MDNSNRKPWHSLTSDEVMQQLHTSEEGLSDAEAAKRLQEYGKNNLRQTKAKSVWENDLGTADRGHGHHSADRGGISLVMYFLEDEGLAECIVILAVIALNTTVGVVQEKKAANALEALKNMTAPSARVLREGEESVVPASDLVPGDIIYLEDGAIVPRGRAHHSGFQPESAGSGAHG